MSRGPGRIERAIRALFDAHPEEAFTTDDLCVACYPDLEQRGLRLAIDAKGFIDRKHRTAVVRAAKKMLTGDPDWRSRPLWDRGNMLIFFNAASVPSVAMRRALDHGTNMRREWVVEQTQRTLDGQHKWEVEDRESAERCVRQHLAVRDAADPAEAERLLAEHEAERQKQVALHTQMLRAPSGGGRAA